MKELKFKKESSKKYKHGQITKEEYKTIAQGCTEKIR